MGPYATWADIEALAARGHEIACHTYSHLDCGRARAARIAEDEAANARAFREHGLPDARTFAYPYGDVSLQAKRTLQARFGLLRALHHGVVGRGDDLNQAPAVGVEGPDGEAVARRWIDRAAERRAWLILYTHDVAPAPSPWGCTPEALAGLVDLALEKGLQVVTAAEGARRLQA